MKDIGDSIKGNDMSVYNDPRALQFSFMLVTYISIIIMIAIVVLRIVHIHEYPNNDIRHIVCTNT